MKKICLPIMIVIFASGCTKPPEPGSSLAAKLVAIEDVRDTALDYKVVVRKAPFIKGDKALVYVNVESGFGYDRACFTVGLLKSPTAPHGWQVKATASCMGNPEAGVVTH